MDTYTYRIGNKIYLNLTNRCSNNCDFCIRRNDGYKEYGLWLTKEPSAEDVINALTDIDSAEEVVFCGYGEPIYRLDIIPELCDYIHKHGKKTRINTNGQGDLIWDTDVAAKLKGYIDTVSISLNATDARSYQEICHSEYGEKAFYALLDFAKKCKEKVSRVILSVVDVIGEDAIAKAREIADSLGVELRVRAYLD